MCGARSDADVDAVVCGGADSVGVIVGVRHHAEDAVDLSTAARLLSRVPPYVGRYAVTHLLEADGLIEVGRRLPIDTLQIHDRATPEVVGAVRRALPHMRVLKSLHVTDRVPPGEPYLGHVDGFLLDSIDSGTDRIGGTGKVHDWALSAAFTQRCRLPVVLAGGLNPDNVGLAIATVAPWGVNVNSGVERDGGKSTEMVEALVREAHDAWLRSPGLVRGQLA